MHKLSIPPTPPPAGAPSRHSRDATVYGHTTTAMHKLSTPPPPPPTPTTVVQYVTSYLADDFMTRNSGELGACNPVNGAMVGAANTAGLR